MPNEVNITVTSTNKSRPGFQEVERDAKRMGSTVGAAMDDAADEMSDKFDSLGAKLGTAGKAVGAAAGVAVGGALAVGFAESVSIDAAQKKLQAQLGGSAEYSAEMGKIAGDLYANAYGDSMEQVGDAVRIVVQSGALMEDATNEQIQSITAQAMSLASAFDVDVAESMRAVGQMVRTGMVPDAQAGLDLITVAFRQLGPQAQDVLDTFTEYSTQFRKLGIDGAEALGMVQQMVKAGARDTDVAADALKELSIRAIDGSKAAGDAYKALGLNQQEMMAKFAQGGPVAEQAFATIIDRIKATQGQADAATIAFGLFGTQSEDLGAALYAIDPSTAVKGLGDLAGAAKSVDEALGESAQAKITGMQRSMEQMLASFVNAPGILGDTSAALMAFGGGALEAVSQVGLIAIALPDKFKAMAVEAIANFGRMTVAATAHAAASVASAVASAAAWVAANAAMILATGGIVLAIGAIVAAIVWMITHWDTVKRWAGIVWEAVKVAWEGIKTAILAVVDFLVNLFMNFTVPGLIISHWETIKRVTGEVWDWIKNAINTAVDWIVNIFLNFTVPGLIIKHWETIKRAFSDGVNAAVGFVRELPSRLLSILSGLGNMFTGVGRDIIDGIWTGLKNGWNWLTDQVGNLARSLLNAAKSALGIGSPSKEFANVIGRMIPPGVAQGVEATAEVARRAIRELAVDDLIGTARQNTTQWGPHRGAARADSGASQGVVIRLDSGGTQLDKLLLEVLSRSIRIQGGNVQLVLGGR